MSNKNGAVCKGDRYAKASLGIQIFFLAALVGGIMFGIFAFQYILSYITNIQNVIGQIPIP
jgi:hypothetical protein